MTTPVHLSRRGFVLACAAVPFAGACARMTYVSGRYDAGRIVVARADLGARAFALVEVPSLAFPVYVHRHASGEYSAVLTRCTHRGCTVEPAEGRLACPCHGSEYTPDGTVLKGPAELPLVRFAVTTDAEYLYIHGTAEADR